MAYLCNLWVASGQDAFEYTTAHLKGCPEPKAATEVLDDLSLQHPGWDRLKQLKEVVPKAKKG
eukprot:7702169-Lingulodinium_polyedra.AAC.1